MRLCPFTAELSATVAGKMLRDGAFQRMIHTQIPLSKLEESLESKAKSLPRAYAAAAGAGD